MDARSARSLGLSLLVLAASSCAGCKGAEPPPPPPTSPLHGMKVENVPLDLSPSHPSMATLGSKIFTQLDAEKRKRPQTALSAERVAEVFRKEGIETVPLKQGLGGPVQASYCAMSRTKKGVSFTVCEYVDEKAAQVGRGISEKRYGEGGLGRKLFVNGASLLVVRQVAQTEEAAAEAQKMAQVFASLR